MLFVSMIGKPVAALNFEPLSIRRWSTTKLRTDCSGPDVNYSVKFSQIECKWKY